MITRVNLLLLQGAGVKYFPAGPGPIVDCLGIRILPDDRANTLLESVRFAAVFLS